MSRLCSSSTVKTKWAASRVAASLVRSPASRSTHHSRGEPVTRSGSNTHTVPIPARSSLVAAHRSARTLVAATGPGADRMCGMPCVVVFPERGAMTAIVVSSQDAYRAGPRPDGLSRSPSSRPVSAGDSLRGLTAARDGRSRMAFLAAGTDASSAICGLRDSAATGSSGRGMRRPINRHATATAAAAAQARMSPAAMTTTVGVPGHAWAVCPRRTV